MKVEVNLIIIYYAVLHVRAFSQSMRISAFDLIFSKELINSYTQNKIKQNYSLIVDNLRYVKNV